MEPGADKRPTMREQIETVTRLRNGLRGQFVRYGIDAGVTGISFVGFMNLTFDPFLIGMGRYLQIANALDGSFDITRLGLLGVTCAGTVATAVRMAQFGGTMNRIVSIQRELRTHEQQTETN